MRKSELISMLLYDVALEHSAIVQYLYHIFLIGDPNITEEIEKIARQEMRHMKWFAQKVVQLGGEVELKRIEEEINLGGPDWKSMIANDVNAEQVAIETYTRQLEEVKDDSVKRLLERVIVDESEHKHEFEEILEAIEDKEPLPRTEVDRKTVEVLNSLLKEEYRIVLDYLHSFFHSKNCDHKDVMLDLAIESMVHMGELGEKIGELGGQPDLSMPPVGKGKRIEDHILYEEDSKEEYIRKAEEVSDPSVKRLLMWIKNQEEYHRHKLIELRRKTGGFTVGDLKKKG